LCIFFLLYVFANSISVGICCAYSRKSVLAYQRRPRLVRRFRLCTPLFWLSAHFYHRLRVYLSKVKSLITDFGTEKQINDFPDILCDLLTYLNVQLPADATTYSHLFPNSVSSPGWGHICDGLLRFVLCTFPWFAAWLRDLKFLIRFLHNHRDNLVELFMRSNCKGAASVLKKQGSTNLQRGGGTPSMTAARVVETFWKFWTIAWAFLTVICRTCGTSLLPRVRCVR
jgi:hypothetical protein